MSRNKARHGAGRVVSVVGSLPQVSVEDRKRLSVFLLRGGQVVGRADPDGKGKFCLSVRVGADADPASALEVAIAPRALTAATIPNELKAPRLSIETAQLEKAERELVVAADKLVLNEEIFRIWWLWCRNYCLSGRVVDDRGCPVPGAVVTVLTVNHAAGGGFTTTPRATVTTDINGNFTNACFEWCSFCYAWPCWPIWWECWPWWWEWDILHVLQQIEQPIPIPHIGPGDPGPLRTATERFPLKQPDADALMVGQGFVEARIGVQELLPNAARTEQIRRKLSDPRIRAIFPWYWWCCRNPNIIFRVTQGANVIVDEDPATQTRWCFPAGDVTLIANQSAISACGGDPKPSHGFVWTRVGDTLVSNIHEGYADGDGTNASDLAFTGGLNIYGEFAAGSTVSYYQVHAGDWSGNPARGGTAPASPGGPIGTPLYNYAVMDHGGGVITVDQVKMGPFNNGALTNLYATQEARPGVSPTLLPPMPAGTLLAWSFNGLKVSAGASAILGASQGAVELTVSGFDGSFAPVTLPSNTADTLDLEIDTTPLTTAKINSFKAFHADGTPVTSTAIGDCPAFLVGPGGYVVLNVTVADNNGHILYYELVPNFGHGSLGVTTPDVRGYKSPVPLVPAPVPGPYSAPDVSQKEFDGGTEDITYVIPENCCYDFRLNVQKRTTNGSGNSGSFVADFWTATVNVT
jgi:hypothetical protein